MENVPFLPKTLGIKNTASGRLTAEEIDDIIDVKLAKLQRKAEEGAESLG